MTTWSSPLKSTVEKSINTEDDFVLLTEDNFYLLQEDDAPDWGGATKNTPTWSSGGQTKATTTWSSPTKN